MSWEANISNILRQVSKTDCIDPICAFAGLAGLPPNKPAQQERASPSLPKRLCLCAELLVAGGQPTYPAYPGLPLAPCVCVSVGRGVVGSLSSRWRIEPFNTHCGFLPLCRQLDNPINTLHWPGFCLYQEWSLCCCRTDIDSGMTHGRRPLLSFPAASSTRSLPSCRAALRHS